MQKQSKGNVDQGLVLEIRWFDRVASVGVYRCATEFIHTEFDGSQYGRLFFQTSIDELHCFENSNKNKC